MTDKRAAWHSHIGKGALYSAFAFANNGIGFVLMLVLAGAMSPAHYGSLSLYNTLVALLTALMALCTNSYFNVAFFQKSREQVSQVVTIVVAVASAVAAACALAVAFAPDWLSRLTGLDARMMLVAVMVCYLQVYNNLRLNAWRLQEQPLRYGLFAMGAAVLNFGVTLWLVIGLKRGWEGRPWAELAVSAAFFVASVVMLHRDGFLTRRITSKALIAETLSFAMPLLPHSLSLWMRQNIDRYIINLTLGTEAVGIFTVAATFALVIVTVGNAFNMHNSVSLSKSLSAGLRRAMPALRRFTLMMSGVFVLLSAAVWGISAIGIPWLLPRYAQSLPLLLPLCAGALCQCLYLLEVNYLFFYKRTVSLMVITTSMAIAQLALSVWLTPKGLIYTAYVSMAVSLLTYVLVRLQAVRLLKRVAADADYERQFLRPDVCENL